MNLKTLALTSAVAVLVSPAISVSFGVAAPAAPAFAAIDTDHDGTIDLNEAKAAAGALFDKLDVDHDGTLDHKELRGRISVRAWKAADPDNDKTVSKDEYLNFVESVFKRVDRDSDGTVDAKELGRAKGSAILRLLQ
jgi:Ca2+-binding EF-hand superfamily protein